MQRMGWIRLLGAIMAMHTASVFAEDESGRYVDVAEMDRIAEQVDIDLARETDPAGFVQYRTLALAFTSAETYANPFSDVRLHAVIRGPEGTEHRVDGFYDGDGVWRIRYCPLAPGEYIYTTTCSNAADAGLHGKSGAFTAAPAPADEPNPLYRHGGNLRVSPNGRYLTYHDGTPFYWLGDTWWFVPTQDHPYEGSSTDRFKSMYQLTTRLRREQGFSVIQCAFLGAKPAFDAAGEHEKAVFLKPERWTEDATAFWKQADRYFLYANHSGFVMSIGLLWTWDFEHLGWKAEDVAEAFRYVQARYGSYGIVWYVVAEYNAVSPEVTREHIRVAAQLREFDPYKTRPMTIMPWPPYMAGKEAWDEPWFGFTLLQGGHFREPGQAMPRNYHWEAYQREGRTLPVIVGEENFERIYDKQDDDGDVRAAAYRAMLCGACGFTYGATGLWYPNRDDDHIVDWDWGNAAWFRALDYPGAKQMGLMRKLFASFPWWELTPDPEGIIEEGYPNEWDIPVMARKGDDLILVYLPPNTPKDRPVLSRRIPEAHAYRARFYDVRTGAFVDAPACVAEGDAARLPDRPADGDWVLALDKPE